MRNFDLPIFLNIFYYKNFTNKHWASKKVWINLQILYGLGLHSSRYLCILFGINSLVKSSKLKMFEWEVIYYYLIENVNLKLFDLKNVNVNRFKTVKNYKGWRHIFNLPTRGQRSHTNAKTRKRYRIN